jgi:hypothetical protein
MLPPLGFNAHSSPSGAKLILLAPLDPNRSPSNLHRSLMLALTSEDGGSASAGSSREGGSGSAPAGRSGPGRGGGRPGGPPITKEHVLLVAYVDSFGSGLTYGNHQGYFKHLEFCIGVVLLTKW